MSIHGIVNNEIILKNLHEFFQIIFEGFIYYLQVRRRSIFYSKSHYYPSKGSLIYYKCCFVFTFWCYKYLMISQVSIEKRINIMPYSYVWNLIYKRQWVWIFLCGYVQFLKSIQILNFWFFLQIIIIGDNQVTSSTCCINLATNVLSILFYNCS
jgi:hypothetical protein